MKKKNGNGSSSKAAIKAYIDSQLSVMKKHGTKVHLSKKAYNSLVQKVAKACNVATHP